MNKIIAASFLIALCACSNASNPSGFSPSARTVSSVRRAASSAIAYVAEVCDRPAIGYCKKQPNGLIETLDGTMITSGIDDPWSLAFDSNGNLYAGSQNGTAAKGFVTEYAPDATSPSRTITNVAGTPRALAIDASNNVYVVGNAKAGCCSFFGWGEVFGPSGNKPLQKLTGVASFPGRPVFDAQG
ncbi:MAG TPA: hypothetical protein VGF18_03630, partial [Candidatus Tumulicola sp.]